MWTRGWLETEIKRRASDPKARLLSIFDVFDGWFRKTSFEGCSFIKCCWNRERAARYVARPSSSREDTRYRPELCAEDASLREPEKFAQVWHMLMKGSIVSAGEGNRNAAREAKFAAMLVLNGWPQKKAHTARAEVKRSGTA